MCVEMRRTFSTPFLQLSLKNIQNSLSDAYVAQLVERILGKDEVIGSIPIVGSILF